MKTGFISLLTSLALAFGAAQGMAASVDHSQYVKGPFKDGPSVTKVCLGCHAKQAEDFAKTSHWKWQGPTKGHVKGLEKSDKEYGKANMINNFCTSVQGGPNGMVHEACAKCHAGYGWTTTKFDFKDTGKIDCLVCHAQKGDYIRKNAKDIDEFTDLEVAAKSVGLPKRQHCGTCHFKGGGGDAVKHGELDTTLNNPTKSLDVHMGSTATGGLDMSCQECHKTKNHSISGASTMMATYDGRVLCEDCHTGAMAPHKKSKNGAILNNHLGTVACQTCHIPTFARGQAVRMSWDWSFTGKHVEPEKKDGLEVFRKSEGVFTWGKNVVPTYAWYNGKIDRYMEGQKIKDPKSVVFISRPDGDIQDKTAKIYPFKVFTGKQPMDAKFKYLNIFQQYKSLWVDYNWEKALKRGAEGSGLPYSGKFQFVKTANYILATHQVAPKEEALACGQCHMGGRMNWKALGYKGDPLLIGGRFSKLHKK